MSTILCKSLLKAIEFALKITKAPLLKAIEFALKITKAYPKRTILSFMNKRKMFLLFFMCTLDWLIHFLQNLNLTPLLLFFRKESFMSMKPNWMVTCVFRTKSQFFCWAVTYHIKKHYWIKIHRILLKVKISFYK